jgi:site-specific DNA-adenine methylase
MINKKEDRVKFLEDRIVFDYGTLRRIYGEADEHGIVEVLYADIPNLPLEPKSEFNQYDMDTDDEDYERLAPIHVEKVGKSIVFYLHRVTERATEPPEESLNGPYLVDQRES